MSLFINHPRRRRTARLYPYEGVDRISKLPESIIAHILSLLPTEDAVVTSSLSKNWRFQWRNIHNLNFNHHARRINPLLILPRVRNRLFSNFVNNVLNSLNGQCIDNFSLEIDRFSEVNNVTNWIAAVVSRNPKKIEVLDTVSIDSEVRFQMPCSLFTCKRLEVLYLQGRINLNLPSSVSLPNLKSLTLELVNYQCDECVPKLISGCSSLVTLNVVRQAYDNVVTFTISSPTLRCLSLDFYDGDSFPEELDYKLEINAPQLKFLRLTDFLSKDFSVENLCLLDDARIDVCEGWLDENDHHSKRIINLLQGLYNVKTLAWMGYALEDISHSSLSTSFPRLSRLTLQTTCSKFLLNFVETSKKLEFLTISKYGRDTTHESCWRKPDEVPDCLLSCLKTMSIEGFEGLADELSMVAYILKNAKVLRRMTLHPAYSLDTNARLQLHQEVSKFPRGSEECDLHLLDHGTCSLSS